MVYLLPNIPENPSRAICASLIGILPPPAEVTPEQIELRDERAITALAHYIPMNAAEGELAVDIVAAQFQARHALHEAALYLNDPVAVDRCRRQHGLMMRTMHAGVRTLLRMQADRHKAEDAQRPVAMLRAGHLHSGTLPPEPKPQPPAAEPEPSVVPTFEDMSEAEQFAVIYPDRAIAIRRYGDWPSDARFPPPDRPIINEIVTSQSPVFRALDARAAQDAAAKSATPSHATFPRDTDENEPGARGVIATNAAVQVPGIGVAPPGAPSAQSP